LDTRWQIRLLGGLRAEGEGRSLCRFRRQKTGILLAYLAYYLHRTHPRDALIELLWPDADLNAARASLSVALSFLRQHLEPPGRPPGSVLIADRASVRLNPEAVSTDVAAFEAAFRAASDARCPQEQCRGFALAVECYQGELLPGCYDEWARLARERLAEAYLQALSRLTRLHEAERDFTRALETARRAVSVDPLREESHRDLMRLLAGAGQPHTALRHFAELERLLKAELDAEPAAETRKLVASLRGSLRSPCAVTANGSSHAERQADTVTLHASGTSPGASAASEGLPTGTVTFLLTQVPRDPTHEQRLAPAATLLSESPRALQRRLFRQHGGHEVREQEDGFLVAFRSAGDAQACAVALQHSLAVQGRVAESEPLPEAIDRPPPLRVRAALHTADTRFEEGEYRTPALEVVERMIEVGHRGQILCSEATAALLRRDLDPGVCLFDLGVYRLPGLDVPERIFQLAATGSRPDAFPPLRAEAGHTAHLPPVSTRFFGRERERELLEKLLGSAETRLVTLLGPGGSGKTRLALEVARALVQAWRGAVWLVPLAEVTEAERIPEAICQALSLAPAARETPLAHLAEALADRPALLLLDNLEHLLPAGAAPVRGLLEQLPAVTCLVTSRRRLNLAGERVFFVPPLPVPAPSAPLQSPGSRPHVAGESVEPGDWSLERLTAFPSVQLFVDRAQAGAPQFALTEGNAAAVAALCRRLEGLPLALELAAARAAVLTPEQILVQMERGVGVLSSRQEDAAARHRSLRAAVEWSYRLLDPSLQRFFAALSVFRGGWSLEGAEGTLGRALTVEGFTPSATEPGAEAVCGDRSAAGKGLALDLLEQLRECSLVLAEETPSRRPGGAEVRFRLLETLREYGREQLSEPERSELERRHAEHFLAWAEYAREEMRQGREAEAWQERLETDHDNLRAALSWAVERGQEQSDEGAEIGLRLAAALAAFWEVRGHLSEGREWLGAALALPGAVLGTGGSLQMRSLRARALRGAGALAWRQGDYGPARTLLEESLAIQRDLGDLRGVVSALHILGAVAYNQGDFDASRDFGTRALEVSREIDSASDIAISLHNLANVAQTVSDHETATPLFRESLARFRELGDRYDQAYCLHGLARGAHCQGDWGRARDLYEECLAIRRELGDRIGVSMALETLGVLVRDQGDYATARAYLEESLAIRRELGDRRGIASSIHGLATVASQQGDLEAAFALLEESLALFRKGGDRHIGAVPLTDLASLLTRRGDYGTARALLDESLGIFREARDRLGIGTALCHLGALAAEQGDVEAAGRWYRESLAAFGDMGEPFGMARALEGLGRLAGAGAQPWRAAQLYAAAAALRAALGAPIPAADRAAYEHRLAALRACLGEAAFTQIWAEGRVMPREQFLKIA
jgi:predicted ATPase/DNA-binding SARP family transcriptional activator